MSGSRSSVEDNDEGVLGLDMCLLDFALLFSVGLRFDRKPQNEGFDSKSGLASGLWLRIGFYIHNVG